WGGRLVGQRVGDGAVRGDVDLLRVLRDGDLRHERIAIQRDYVSALIEVELAGAGVSQRAVRLLHLEKAVALNDEVERVVGLRERSLREDRFVGRRARAQAELQA